MDLVLRAVTIYLVVFALTRILGRREMSSLQPFDLILLVVIGDLVQSGISQSDLSVTGVMIVLITIGLMQVFTSFLSFRSRRLRHLLQGEPIVLVHHGHVVTKNLRRERLDLDDLAQRARVNGVSSIDEVKWAVLETNGEISFIT